MKDLNLTPESIHFLQENTGGKLTDICLSSFCGSDSKGKEIKSKKKQVGLQQMKKLLHGKENHNQY